MLLMVLDVLFVAVPVIIGGAVCAYYCFKDYTQ